MLLLNPIGTTIGEKKKEEEKKKNNKDRSLIDYSGSYSKAPSTIPVHEWLGIDFSWRQSGGETKSGRNFFPTPLFFFVLLVSSPRIWEEPFDPL